MKAKLVFEDGQEVQLSEETTDNLVNLRKPEKKIWVAVSRNKSNEIDRILVRIPRKVWDEIKERSISFFQHDFENDEIVVTFDPRDGRIGATLSPRYITRFYNDIKPALEI